MDIFKLMGTIAINNAGAHSAMDATSKKASGLQNSMQKAFDNIGKAAVKCGKTIAKGLLIGKASIAALSIKAYADYEQLVGGVETLFKESSSTILKYADMAYKTAGLSANDYMSTVTSFSASLLQGLGGDTAAAAEMANMAITDMADNANKMGTEMSSIQYAYQGFAKKNYTMLDNLKLGYGGTAAEMARLVNESGVLGEGITVTAETINDVSFDTIIRAIHMVQTEMGITGTTAKEAAETISGSFSSMKASWTNLMIGIADGNQDINVLTDRFAESFMTVFSNIAKRIPHIGVSIGKIFRKLTPELLKAVRNWWNGGDGVLQSILDIARWVLPMFGLPYNHDVMITIKEWWNDAKKIFQKVCTWAVNIFDHPQETLTDIKNTFSKWWAKTGLPAVKAASQWALGLFGVPIEDNATIEKHIKTWWDVAKDIVTKACSWTLQLFGLPEEDANTIANSLKGWFEGVAELVSDSLQWEGWQSMIDGLEWLVTNKDALKAALTTIAVGMIAGAVAAHPYATLISTVVSGLAILAAEGEKIQKENERMAQIGMQGFVEYQKSDEYALPYTEEDLILLQRYIDLRKEYNMLVNEVDAHGRDMYFRHTGRTVDAVKTEMDRLAEYFGVYNPLHISLYDDYVGWLEKIGHPGELLDIFDKNGNPVGVPVEVSEDSEGTMQKQLGDMDLTATATVYPDLSHIYAVKDFVSQLLSGGIDAGGGGEKPEGFATGLDFVPFNEMPARLHYGEAVLTKEDASIWRRQQKTIVQNVNIDTESLAASIAEAVQQRPIAMNIDGKSFAALMAKEMSRSIGNRNIQTLMGMGG